MIEKLKKELSKIEVLLDKCRTSALTDGFGTMRHAKKSVKWDYYAKEKMRLIFLIEDDMENYIVKKGWSKYDSKSAYVHEDIKIILSELGVYFYIAEYTDAQFEIGEAYETQKMYEDSINRKIHSLNI